MISNINDSLNDDFVKLGLQVNGNFAHLFKLNEINNGSNNYLYGYYDNNKLVGFIHLVKLVDEMEIINIVVDKEYRGKGIGSSLMEYVITTFKGIKSLFLEVNVNNDKAIALYNKFDFQVINIRKKYYGNDDCYVMRKEL